MNLHQRSTEKTNIEGSLRHFKAIRVLRRVEGPVVRPSTPRGVEPVRGEAPRTPLHCESDHSEPCASRRVWPSDRLCVWAPCHLLFPGLDEFTSWIQSCVFSRSNTASAGYEKHAKRPFPKAPVKIWHRRLLSNRDFHVPKPPLQKRLLDRSHSLKDLRVVLGNQS